MSPTSHFHTLAARIVLASREFYKKHGRFPETVLMSYREQDRLIEEVFGLHSAATSEPREKAFMGMAVMITEKPGVFVGILESVGE